MSIFEEYAVFKSRYDLKSSVILELHMPTRYSSEPELAQTIFGYW